MHCERGEGSGRVLGEWGSGRVLGGVGGRNGVEAEGSLSLRGSRKRESIAALLIKTLRQPPPGGRRGRILDGKEEEKKPVAKA